MSISSHTQVMTKLMALLSHPIIEAGRLDQALGSQCIIDKKTKVIKTRDHKFTINVFFSLLISIW